MRNAISEIVNQTLDRLIVSNPKNKTNEFKKIVVRPVFVKGKEVYQFEKYTQKQVFHDNCTKEECIEKVIALMEDFRQCDAFCAEKNYVVKVSKKGKVFVSSKENKVPLKVAPKQHNRTKNYLIPDGTFVEPLYDLGVFMNFVINW